ncbi:MAG: NADH-quinone oxidoreductase subunit NuoH [Chloroflexi bacterium]|nr:MAG: NADH-quinone oxidoreductase subunit NuoH [Phototrophicales bacterium]RMF79432.1 MAG: NADH-quinone oxidoreductase subunit NuoH [Chloroflexota bacterium]
MVGCISDLSACLIDAGIGPGLAGFLETLVGTLIVTLLPLTLVIILVWIERKYSARVQDRVGPNRVGPFGLLQPAADAVKMITKEDITPAGADRIVYNIAPILSALSVILIWAVIPFSPVHIGVDLSIGVLYFFAVGSVGALAVMLGGWSSNNKYALLGAFRVVAQLISYEVPNILAALMPVMIAGTLSMQGLVHAQAGMWFAISLPLSALLFFISSIAEVGRTPFDLLEAESEIVAGFNIEYSGMKFGLFMAGEFLHVLTIAILTAVIFFGGWLGPGVQEVPALGWLWLAIKSTILYLLALHMRSTLPRVRIDQLMSFNWKFLVPLSLVNIIVVAFLFKLVQELGLTPAADETTNIIANLPQTFILLLGNLAIIGGVLVYLRGLGREQRLANEMAAAVDEDVEHHPHHDEEVAAAAVAD